MNLRGVPPMIFSGNLAEHWKLWKQRFLMYLQATEISKKEDVTKCVQLLTLIGEEGIRIFNTFKIDEIDKNKLEVLVQKFDEYFNPKRNLAIERHKLLTCKQKEGQSIENYITELKSLALSCELENLESSLVKDILICGIINESLREKLLLEDVKTLEEAIKICVNTESTKERNKQISSGNGNSSQSIYSVRQERGVKKNRYYRQEGTKQETKQENPGQCSMCSYSHRDRPCPAQGKNVSHVTNLIILVVSVGLLTQKIRIIIK